MLNLLLRKARSQLKYFCNADFRIIPVFSRLTKSILDIRQVRKPREILCFPPKRIHKMREKIHITLNLLPFLITNLTNSPAICPYKHPTALCYLPHIIDANSSHALLTIGRTLPYQTVVAPLDGLTN